MNKKRRKEIRELINELEELKEKIEIVLEEEQDYYDNMPENLQGSERGEIAESAISELEESLDNIDNAIENLECAEIGS